MKDNTNNKEFWNNYVTYWENKVDQANNEKNAIDKTSDDKMFETYFRKLNVKKEDKVLDYGCGSGRLYPIYKNVVGEESCNYFGIDVSGVSLEHAQKRNLELEINKNLLEFDGLHIPYEDETFDKIVCFGVFDACNQEKVIEELFRVLKKDGLILITGKNNKYFSDDEAALIAEINARKKEHPNYFTDVHELVKQLTNHGVKIIEKYFFLRREDFPINDYVTDMPEEFYQWALIIKKTSAYQKVKFKRFSYVYSDTYRNLQSEIKQC